MVPAGDVAPPASEGREILLLNF